MTGNEYGVAFNVEVIMSDDVRRVEVRQAIESALPDSERVDVVVSE